MKRRGYALGRHRRPGRRRGDLRQLPPRPRRLGAAHGRLARPADEPGRAADEPARRATRCGSRSTSTSSAPPSRRCATASRSRTRAADRWAADGGAIVALDPRDGSVLALASYPTFEPSVYVSRDPRKLAPLQNDKVAAEKRYPGPRPRARRHLSARLDVEAGHGARGDAGAHPHAVLGAPLHAGLQGVRRRSSTTGTRTPTAGSRCRPRSPSRATPTSTELGQRLLRAAGEPGPPAPELGLALRLRRADRASTSAPRRPGSCRRRSGARSTFARHAVQRDRPHLEAGLLDPDGDRPGRPHRDADPDGALLRDDRERRPARHAAHRRGRRAADRRPEGAAGRCAASPRRRRPRPASTRPRSRSSAPASSRRRTRRSAPRRASSARSRSRSRARPARPRSSSRCRARRRRARSTSRGGAATGRPRTRRSSSAP